VDGSDYALIDNTFNQISALGAASLAARPASEVSASAATSVPEPSMLGLGLALGPSLRQRRRRS